VQRAVAQIPFPAKIGRAGKFELGGKPFAQGNEIFYVYGGMPAA
jgi:hypothetical protein